jgi:hypothetical protein
MIAGAGCGSDEPCSVQSEDFLFELGRIENDLTISIGTVLFDGYDYIEDLEETIKEVKGLRSPRCARDVKANLVNWLEASVVALKAGLTHGEVSVEYYAAEREVREYSSDYFLSKFNVEEDLED